MGDGLLSLNWNNHGATFCHTLAALRGKDKYTDVTVSCGGKFYQVHKLVLSTCSEYFEKIFDNTPCKHPVIVLRDVQCDELESLLNYMYKGVVSVAQNDLSRLIKVAELLQIKGLAVPDEPPSASKSLISSNKRNSDGHMSPRSNADSISPYPKKRRRRTSDSYQPGTSGPSSAHQHKNDAPQGSNWSEDQDSRFVEDRLRNTAHERVRSPVTVNVDETLVKEEILDDDERSDLGESSDYGGGMPDPMGESSQDGVGLMIPKFDDSSKSLDQGHSPVTLPDPVVEALAGPSGLQGWADGGDMARRMNLGEGFGSGDSQDMSSSVGLPSSAQPHQMVVIDWREPDEVGQMLAGFSDLDSQTKRPHVCPQCNFTTNSTTYFKEHVAAHLGVRQHACRFCAASFSNKTTLINHERTHTGEKPFHCKYCQYSCTRKQNLNRHLVRMHKEMLESSEEQSMMRMPKIKLEGSEEHSLVDPTEHHPEHQEGKDGSLENLQQGEDGPIKHFLDI